jgi:NDP-sugar pyrophosphorylase family protein
MDAVILAAGKGTRLRPYTLDVPKPLLPVQGRPILDWTLAALPASVARVLVVVHYLADRIEAYLRGQQHVRDWQLVEQAQPLGTGHAFRCCAAHLQSSRCLVLNGDDLYGARDLQALVQHPAAILVQPVPDPRRWGIALVRPDGSLERLLEKPDMDGPALGNLGAYVLPAEAAQLDLPLSARGEYEITDAVTWLASRQRVEVVQAGFWFPIGSVEAWQQAQSLDLSPLLRP